MLTQSHGARRACVLECRELTPLTLCAFLAAHMPVGFHKLKGVTRMTKMDRFYDESRKECLFWPNWEKYGGTGHFVICV